jgi:predicted short-subunit dehydrogenase-like oxidoreductase (DUF2520 family)
MQIGLLGPGRLGRTLARLLADRGHRVDLRGRGELPSGEVILLTVPDAALPEAARSIPPGPVVLHCSGAAEVDVLRPHAPAGSLHPLMTFPGPEVAIPDLAGVPAAVAGDPAAQEAARAIARSLGMSPFSVPGDRRLYHAAAVMAGNFATVLLADAAAVLAAAGVDPADAPGLLAPLALQSLRNAAADPAAALTGPAARGDSATIERHRAALREAGLPDALALYDLLTAHATALARLRPRSSP